MKDIDKLFENEIKKNQIPYSESHWEAMEALIQKDKKRKFFIYFTSATLVLTMLTIGVYYGFESRSKANSYTTVDHSKTSQLKENTHTSNSKPSTSANSDLEKASNSYSDKANNLAFDKHTTQEKQVVLQIKNDEQLNLNIEKQDEKVEQIVAVETPEVELRNVQSGIIHNSEDQASPMFGTTVRKHLSYPKNLQPFSYDFNSDQSFVARLNMLDKLLALHPKDPDKPVKEWYLSPYVNYNLFAAPVYEAKIASYKQAEELKSTLGYGLNVKLKMGHWSFTSGMQYNSFKALANYNIHQRSVSYDTTIKIINYDYSKTNLGTRIALLKKFVDSSVANTNSIINPNEKITFSYIGLPLNVQYNLGYKKLSYFVEAGMLTQFLIAQKGRYVQYNEGKVDFGVSRQSQNKVLLNAQFGLGVSYPVFKNISVFTSYNYITNLNSMVNGYNQKLGNNRFNFGFDFKLK